MSDIKQLPFLVRLVDDDSPKVQETIVKELDSFGPDLERYLLELPEPPSRPMLSEINELLNEYRRKWMAEAWKSWIVMPEDIDKLEEGFRLISDFQNGNNNPNNLSRMLDRVAEEFRLTNDPHSLSVPSLADYLFAKKKIVGAEDNYYDYRNSDLVHVLQSKEGIPISLCCIFVLVGKRLGMEIHGCNYPGHFLSMYKEESEYFLVDCFYGGKILDLSDFSDMYFTAGSKLTELLTSPPSASKIFSRVLLNLNKAYHQVNDKNNANFMLELLKDINIDEDFSDDDGHDEYE